MAIDSKYLQSVVFVSCSWRDEEPELRGTGFVVGVPADDPASIFLYVVTAAHVVRPFASTHIRLTRRDGGIDDLEVPRDTWVFHPFEDIAAAPIVLRPSEQLVSVIGTDLFNGTAETTYNPGIGDEVYFIGLLGQVPSMGTRNVPMVRSGSIGAIHQDGIPIRLPDDTVIHVHGHLIDCRSFGGFSGAPCFVHFLSRVDQTERLDLQIPVHSTLLFGMVGGHFDLQQSVTLPDQDDKLKVPASAGITVLYPSETIMGVIEDDTFVQMRRGDNEEFGAGST